MTKLITLALCLSALVGCDELSEAMTSHDLAIVEANGSTFVLDNSNGSVSVVSGDQLRPLKQASSEIFELEKDVALDSTVVDFEFLFSGSRVYWSGRIAPNPVSQEFEADKLAFSYLTRIAENFGELPNLKIAPNKLGAPILAFEYLAKSLPAYAIQGSHPSPLSRGKKLHGIFKGMADEEAIYLYDGFYKSLDEITCNE